MEGQVSYHTMLTASFQNLERDTGSRRLAQFFDFNLLDGIPKVDGFFSLNLREFSELSKKLYSTTNQPQGLLDLLAVSEISSPTNIVDWSPRRTCLPMITGGQRVVFASPQDTLDALFSAEFNPREVVYFPQEAKERLQGGAQAPVQIQVRKFSSTRVEFETEATKWAAVVAAQTFYHPWHAYVDGQRSRLWRVNYAFQGLEVPPGKHFGALVYEDTAFITGAAVSAISLFVCVAGWLALPRFQARNRGS
jgi:hypothetical protein